MHGAIAEKDRTREYSIKQLLYLLPHPDPLPEGEGACSVIPVLKNETAEY